MQVSLAEAETQLPRSLLGEDAWWLRRATSSIPTFFSGG